MGSLHEGHVSLIRSAASECDVVVVSIFVNPIQFSSAADLARYPTSLSEDLELAAAHRRAGSSLPLRSPRCTREESRRRLSSRARSPPALRALHVRGTSLASQLWSPSSSRCVAIAAPISVRRTSSSSS